MPRKSAAALSVVTPLPEHRRPEPPDELTPEQAEEWRRVVSRLPPEWFPAETHDLLSAYCRRVVRARAIEGLLREFRVAGAKTAEGLARYDKLMMMADREDRAITMLATRMRLTQQSRWQSSTAHVKTSEPNASRKQWQGVA